MAGTAELASPADRINLVVRPREACAGGAKHENDGEQETTAHAVKLH
jgi:hypothetical protein